MAAEVMKSGPGETSCPDLETIAAYLDRRLTESERAAVTEHLASCETCYFVFTEAAQMRVSEATAHESESGVVANPVWWARPKVLWSSGAALAAAASLTLLVNTGIIPGRNGDSAELRALVVAVGTDRTLEARLTGGFAYGPLRATTRGSGTPTSVSADVRIAAARIEKDLIGRRTPDALRMLGLSYLTIGDIDRGVKALEEAVNVEVPDPRALSDLSAAYIARWARSGQTEDLTKALTMADRAVKHDGRLAEASFNRAVALERLKLEDESRNAWSEYLKSDASSAWADEARDRLRSGVR